MLFALNNPLDCDALLRKVKRDIEKGVTLVEYSHKISRTNKQNNYYHVVLRVAGARLGLTKDYVEKHYFKGIVNRDMFLDHERYDKHRGIMVSEYRSSSSLTQEEMSLAIDRFRNWLAQEEDIYIPSGDEWRENKRLQAELEIEIEQVKQYMYGN
jgi:hypothetical protein